MGRYFLLLPEVQMRHMDGSKLRIDYVGYPRDETLRAAWGLVGFEIKRGYVGFKDIGRVLKQAMDYRHAVLADSRIKTRSGFVGKPLGFVFVWPPLPGFYERGGSYSLNSWTEGAVRVAGHYNVGTVAFRQYTEAPGLYVSGSRLWDASDGPADNAADFGSGRGRGSA